MPYSFTLNPFGRVCQAIESWSPRGCKTEKDYENSLVKKLQKELVNQTIIQQYGSARQRVDIVVHKKVPIEVKKDLKSTAALQRTIGQLNQYLKDWEGIILVLCGDVSPDLEKSILEYARSEEEVHVYKV
jgi:hypothetical protein